jgi:peptidoglycan/LPS O-acetylase OafA/YrhL
VQGSFQGWAGVTGAGCRASEAAAFLRNLILPTILVVVGLLLRSLDRIFGLSALALIFGGMTLFVLRDRSALRKLFNKHIFYLTSRLSYGMYLNHFPVLSFAVPLLVAARISNKTYVNFFIGYPLMIFASMAVAAATFILIESPFLQLRERWLAAKNGADEVRKADLKPALRPERP